MTGSRPERSGNGFALYTMLAQCNKNVAHDSQPTPRILFGFYGNHRLSSSAVALSVIVGAIFQLEASQLARVKIARILSAIAEYWSRMLSVRWPLGWFFAFFAKTWPKTCIASLNPDFLGFDLFTWWPQMTLTCIMVTKHRKWCLQMSVTLSMPIHWLCLHLRSKFYSSMSPSPKSRKFIFWPDLWRHQWPPAQSFHLIRVVHVQGYQMAFEFGNPSSSLGDLRWVRCPPPPPTGRITNQTPAGRGLTFALTSFWGGVTWPGLVILLEATWGQKFHTMFALLPDQLYQVWRCYAPPFFAIDEKTVRVEMEIKYQPPVTRGLKKICLS